MCMGHEHNHLDMDPEENHDIHDPDQPTDRRFGPESWQWKATFAGYLAVILFGLWLYTMVGAK